MAILLFKLNNVPDDEALEIRDLLSASDIYFYETHAGFWRIGLDAIWLADNTHEVQARELIREYQKKRTAKQQQNYAQLIEQGNAPTLWQNFCSSPVRFAGFLVAVIFVLTITLVPFLFMFKY